MGQIFNRVMIVDDSPENLNVLGSILRNEGYEVSQFPRGRMAIEAAKKHPPDLILLDIMMPEMDGFETCRELKSLEIIQDIPVIFVSAVANIDQKLTAFQVGGVDYIVKPFYDQEVLERVKTHLSLRQAKHELEIHKENLELIVEERTRDLNDAQRVSKTGSWKYDVSTEKIEWSPMTYRICDIDKNTVPSVELYFSLICEDDKDEFRKNSWNKIFVNGFFSAEHRLCINGKEKWVRSTAQVEYDEDQKPIKIIGTIQDIDDIKKARAKNTLFSKIINQSPAGIIITDQSATIQFVNESFVKNTGYKKDEIIGANPSFMNSGEHPKSYFKELWDTILSKNTWKGELKNRRKDGTVYWDYLIVSPVLNKKGEITNFVGIHENVTLRKQFQQELLESEERYRTIHDQNQSIMYTVNPENGVIEDANPAFFEFYGWPKNSVPGLNISKINSNQKQVRSITKKVANQGHYSTVVMHTKRRGDNAYMQISTSYIKVNGRRVIHVISHDVTQKHIYLKKTLKQNKFMKELAWKQSHEVRAPLTRILSLINFQKNIADEEGLEFSTENLLSELESSGKELDKAIRKMYEKLESEGY